MPLVPFGLRYPVFGVPLLPHIRKPRDKSRIVATGSLAVRAVGIFKVEVAFALSD